MKFSALGTLLLNKDLTLSAVYVEEGSFFEIAEQEIGKSLKELTCALPNLEMGRLAEEARAVVTSKTKSILEFSNDTGGNIRASIFPLLGMEEVVYGVTIRFTQLPTFSYTLPTSPSEQGSLEFYERLLTYFPGRIFIYHVQEKRCIYSSKPLESYLGYSSEEIKELGKEEIPITIHPEDQKDLEAHYDRIANLDPDVNEVFYFEYRIKDKSGEWRWVRSLDIPFSRDEEGRVVEILGNFHDITARKLTQLKLEKVRKFREAISLSMPASIYIYNIQENRNSYATKSIGELLGYSSEELQELGSDLFAIIFHPEEYQLISDHHKRVAQLEPKQKLTLDYRVRHKNGNWLWMQSVDTPFKRDKDGKVIDILGYAADITEKKLAQLEMEEARKMAEDANLAKSEFLSIMSHEIRTPINAVIGMTNLLEDTELNEEQQDYVDTIRLSGNNLLSIISEVLDFSKIEAGKIELENQWTELEDVVGNSLTLLVEKAQRKGLELSYFIDPAIPELIFTDSVRLSQVLANLLSNAVKFTHKGDIVLFIKNKGKDGNNYLVEFEVRDTGIGIPTNRMDKLFQPFSQVDSSISRNFGGTGLGLAISKTLVELLGGNIWASSVEGEGSSFFFTLRTPGKPGEENDDSLFELMGKEILVVDDNPIHLDIFEKRCEAWGLKVFATTCPKEARGVLQARPSIELMITDSHMPGTDGIEFIKSIRKSFPDRRLSILLCSLKGYSWNPAEEVFFDGTLTKPVRTKVLQKKLTKLLELKRTNERNLHKALSASTDLSSHLGPLKILVVEDNLINQKVAIKHLSKLGFQADVAGNGIEALEAWEMIPYDLILMDLQMPEMDGLEATREIRKKVGEGRERPIIVALTANVTIKAKEDSFQAGMDDYLTKPIKKDTFRDILLKWFEKRQIHI